MSENNDDDLEMTTAEKIRWDAATDAMRSALTDPDPEARAAAGAAAEQALSQVDLDAMREKLHVPDDAGEYEDALRGIMLRIPDGWGRWISCSAGWYPLIVQLDRDLAEIDRGYELRQCKEKFGGLRYYSSASASISDEDQERMHGLIRAAEKASETTCELCGNAGELHVSRHSWYRTLCSTCAAEDADKQYRPANEQLDELTPGLPGQWMVTDGASTHSVWDLGRMTCGFYRDDEHSDGQYPIARVVAWPAVGAVGEVQFEDGTLRTTGDITEIRRVR